MSKRYKAVEPEVTVENIKKILETIGLPIKEEPHGDGDMFCSCRVQ